MGMYVGFMLAVQVFTGTPSWQETPDILICHNSGASVYRVERALSFWKNLGHSFGTVKKADRHNMSCVMGEPPYGTIMIDIPSQDFEFGNHLGSTKTWWRTDTGEAFKAKIEIKTGWEDTERILEHEIGHALGFTDNSVTGHMMNGVWAQGGYRKKGLQHQKQH